MKSTMKISGEARRAAIIKTARDVFIEKGFYRTTTRELAEAAGVSEALLFRHFPSKEALYSAIQTSCFKEARSKITERLDSLEPSTAALVSLVRDLITHVLGAEPDEDDRLFVRLALRSLIDEGEFARLAIQGGLSDWVKKVEQCIQAAQAAGDMVETPVRANLGGWFVHHLISGILIHSLPASSIIDYGVPREEILTQLGRFCLCGVGLKEKALRRCCKEQGS
jgi:AcrR family transcriptional regulator